MVLIFLKKKKKPYELQLIFLIFLGIALGKIDSKLLLIVWKTLVLLILVEIFIFNYTAYYRGSMGIMTVYDVTDEQSFASIYSTLFQ